MAWGDKEGLILTANILVLLTKYLSLNPWSMASQMLTLLFILFIFNLATHASKHYLQLTAVVSDEQDDHANFECWEMATPFTDYPTVGTAIPGLADVANVSYVVLPPRSKEGIHKPPYPM